MIFPSTPKSVEAAEVVANAAAVPGTSQDDPPPPYFDAPAPSGSGSRAASEPPLTGVRPTNFLSLSRGSRPIKGTYAIDTRIIIPQALLPPLAPDEAEGRRRNVLLHTSTGLIDVDLFVEGDLSSKVDILLKSSSGPITTRLHASNPSRPALHIAVESSNTPITIHLPPSFCGPVTISTRNPTVHFSDRLAAELTTFSEEEHTRRCFVGDFSAWTEDEWAGDMLSVESTYGSVSLQYDDEAGAWDTPNPFAWPPMGMPHPHPLAKGFPHSPMGMAPGMMHPALWMGPPRGGFAAGPPRGGFGPGFVPGMQGFPPGMHMHSLLARLQRGGRPPGFGRQ